MTWFAPRSCRGPLKRPLESLKALVIPFVSEMRRPLNLDKQNAPKNTLKELQDHIRNFQRAKGSTARIDYSGVTDPKIWDEGKEKPSVEKFKTRVLPELVKVLWKSRGRAFEGKPFQLKETTSGRKVRVDGKKVFRIAIVSHGRYIREATGLETFLEEMKTARKLDSFLSAKVCQPFPRLEGCCTTKDPAIEAVARGKSYSNPNTSIWRAVLIGSNCKNRFKLCGERLEKIYTPAISKEHGGLTPDDISNCPEAVRDTITPVPNYKAGYVEGMPFSG